jgi:hypothetical protein
LTQKVREGGRVVNVAVVIATGVNNEGRRESLGFDVITTEDGAGWTAFLRSLVARGLSGGVARRLRRPPGPEGRFPDAAGMLADAAEDLLAFSTFPAVGAGIGRYRYCS